MVFSFSSGSVIALILLLISVFYFNNNLKKGDMPMIQNLKIQIPTPIMNVIYSVLNTMWAIGCSAAAAMLASSQYDNNQ